MKKIIPIIKVKSFATAQTIKLSEKTIAKTKIAHGFFSEVGNMSMFIGSIFKETFSVHFEFKEFLRQCFEIGNKSLPLVAITGAIMGLVLTIQSRPPLEDCFPVWLQYLLFVKLAR